MHKSARAIAREQSKLAAWRRAKRPRGSCAGCGKTDFIDLLVICGDRLYCSACVQQRLDKP